MIKNWYQNIIQSLLAGLMILAGFNISPAPVLAANAKIEKDGDIYVFTSGQNGQKVKFHSKYQRDIKVVDNQGLNQHDKKIGTGITVFAAGEGLSNYYYIHLGNYASQKLLFYRGKHVKGTNDGVEPKDGWIAFDLGNGVYNYFSVHSLNAVDRAAFKPSSPSQPETKPTPTPNTNSPNTSKPGQGTATTTCKPDSDSYKSSKNVVSNFLYKYYSGTGLSITDAINKSGYYDAVLARDCYFGKSASEKKEYIHSKRSFALINDNRYQSIFDVIADAEGLFNPATPTEPSTGTTLPGIFTSQCDQGGLYPSSKFTVIAALAGYFSKYGSVQPGKQEAILRLLEEKCYFSLTKEAKLKIIWAYRDSLKAAPNSGYTSILDVVADSEGVHSTPAVSGVVELINKEESQADWNYYLDLTVHTWIGFYQSACNEKTLYDPAPGTNKENCFYTKSNWDQYTNNGALDKLYALPLWSGNVANRGDAEFTAEEINNLKKVYSVLLKDVEPKRNYDADFTLDLFGLGGVKEAESLSELVLQTAIYVGSVAVGGAVFGKLIGPLASKGASKEISWVAGKATSPFSAEAIESYLASETRAAASTISNRTFGVSKIYTLPAFVVSGVTTPTVRTVSTKLGQLTIDYGRMLGRTRFISASVSEQDRVLNEIVEQMYNIIDDPLLRSLKNPNDMAKLAEKISLDDDFFKTHGYYGVNDHSAKYSEQFTQEIILDSDYYFKEVSDFGGSPALIHEILHTDASMSGSLGNFSIAGPAYHEGLTELKAKIIACNQFRACGSFYETETQVLRKLSNLIQYKGKVDQNSAIAILGEVEQQGAGGAARLGEIITSQPDPEGNFIKQLRKYLDEGHYAEANSYIETYWQ